MLPDGDGLHLTRELKRRDPAIEIIIITAYGSCGRRWRRRRAPARSTCSRKPFDPDELLSLIDNALDHRKLVTENADLRRRLGEQATDSEILGSAPGIQKVLETVVAVADADANVLIVGESGTGKELLPTRSRAAAAGAAGRGSRSTARRCRRT
jgi:DNA-binding NtrC family response regulator